MPWGSLSGCFQFLSTVHRQNKWVHSEWHFQTVRLGMAQNLKEIQMKMLRSSFVC